MKDFLACRADAVALEETDQGAHSVSWQEL